MMAEPFWECMFRGEHVALELEDLTVKRMRDIKRFFGEDYGIPGKFLALLALEEMDARAAALWIHGLKTGKPIGDPTKLEFHFGEFEPVSATEDPDPKENPETVDDGGEDPTHSSETPTPSAGSSSD